VADQILLAVVAVEKEALDQLVAAQQAVQAVQVRHLRFLVLRLITLVAVAVAVLGLAAQQQVVVVMGDRGQLRLLQEQPIQAAAAAAVGIQLQEAKQAAQALLLFDI
jgi:hypothetical protein